MRQLKSTLMETQDMGLAVALTCLGYELLELEAQRSGNRTTFIFKETEGINEAAQDYWNGKLNVDAKQYWSESKNLKTRLYSLR